jgi:hypothetical protein
MPGFPVCSEILKAIFLYPWIGEIFLNASPLPEKSASLMQIVNKYLFAIAEETIRLDRY